MVWILRRTQTYGVDIFDFTEVYQFTYTVRLGRVPVR